MGLTGANGAKNEGHNLHQEVHSTQASHTEVLQELVHEWENISCCQHLRCHSRRHWEN